MGRKAEHARENCATGNLRGHLGLPTRGSACDHRSADDHPRVVAYRLGMTPRALGRITPDDEIGLPGMDSLLEAEDSERWTCRDLIDVHGFQRKQLAGFVPWIPLRQHLLHGHVDSAAARGLRGSMAARKAWIQGVVVRAVIERVERARAP